MKAKTSFHYSCNEPLHNPLNIKCIGRGEFSQRPLLNTGASFILKLLLRDTFASDQLKCIPQRLLQVMHLTQKNSEGQTEAISYVPAYVASKSQIWCELKVFSDRFCAIAT